MIVEFLDHGDGVGAGHMDGGPIVMAISTLALSLFLLAFAWSLFRPARQSRRTPADIATDRYASGEIDADDFERIVSDIRSHRR